jgi:cytochrome c553
MKGTLLIGSIAVSLILGGSAWAAGDVAAGKAKAAGCAGCHGANGEGKAPNPPLAGKDEKTLAQAMLDYKSGKRPNPAMKAMVSSLSDQDIANLAAYYASLQAK